LFLQEVADVLGAAIERKQAERDTHSLLGERTKWAVDAERRFTFLSEANAQLSISTDYSTVLATAVRLAVPALADWCFVDLVEEPGGSIARFAVAHHDLEGEALALELKNLFPLDPNAPYGTPKVLRSGRPELLPEVKESVLKGIAHDPEHLRILYRLNPKSYMCVPLRVGGHTLGALGLVSAGSGCRYGEEDLALAEGLAYCTALAIDNARRHVPEMELVRELVERAKRDQRMLSPQRRMDAPELTSRQLEVLRLLSEGNSAKEIGQELYLSQATVRNHIRSLLQALGAHSQLEALARAREMGLLSR
jgi:DNA-binding CsgD family transcriptional regulator